MKVINFIPRIGGLFTADDAQEIINSINSLYDILEANYVKEITVDTFAELLNYDFESGKKIYAVVLIDETHSNWPNARYFWDGATLQWAAYQATNVQQPII